MARRYPTRNLYALPYVPTSSHSGREGDFILRGENIWIQANRVGSTFGTCYQGSTDMNETIPGSKITGTVSTTAGSKTLTGSGTDFINELHLGQYLLLVDVSDVTKRELGVIESVESATSCTLTSAAANTLASGSFATRLPIMFRMGTKRGTALRGNALQFPKGHILGVGDGTLRINGQTLAAEFGGDDLVLARQPRFALYKPATGVYDQQDVGLTLPTASSGNTIISLSTSIMFPRVSGAVGTITGISVGTTTKLTFSGAHNWTAGQTITLERFHSDLSTLNATWVIATIPSALTLTVSADTTGATWDSTTGGTLWSGMRTGGYSIRVAAANSETLGYSNPSAALPPISMSGSRAIKVTFNADMGENQNSWNIYGTEYADFDTDNIQAQYMGPWYFIEQVTETQLGSRSAGTSWDVIYSDAEINASTDLLTFDNFAPVDAEFVDLINGIPIYMSCLGRGNPGKLSGSSPGPVAVPSKPSNPEAVYLDKAITTAGGDIIMGTFNTKGRLFALCQNSLQQVILTSLDFEPITFRSLWDAGFRNPYSAVFVKEYLYAFSTQKIIRSVAGGDDSVIEFSFNSDIRDYVVNWDAGKVMVGYDPQNRAVCFFLSAAEKRSGYYVTLVLPFRLDTQIWNPPMVIKAANRDMVVSGVSTVGEKLYFLGGGLKRQSYTVTDATFASPILITTSSAHGLVDGDQVYIQGVAGNNAANGSWIITKNDDTSFTLNGSTGDGSYLLGGTIDLMQIDTYEFDGGDSETKAWYLAWNYTDNGDDETAKKVKGLSCTGKFTNTEVEVHGIRQTGAVDLTTLESGHGLDSLTWNVPDTSAVERVRRVYRDWGPYSLWTVRISGSNTDGGDRFDELVVAYDMEQSTKT